MGKWLDALQAAEKETENITNPNPQNPQNLSDVGFERFEGLASKQFSYFFDAWDDLDWQIAYDERVAILEFDEGLPRPQAARLARQQIDELKQRRWH